MGWFWSFAALGFFRSALEFVFPRFGVWSVSQLFGKGCFLLAGSGLEVNWFGVGQGGVKCVNFNGLAGLSHVWSCLAWLGALELFSCGGQAPAVGRGAWCRARRALRPTLSPTPPSTEAPARHPMLKPDAQDLPPDAAPALRPTPNILRPTLRPTRDPLPDTAPDAAPDA